MRPLEWALAFAALAALWGRPSRALAALPPVLLLLHLALEGFRIEMTPILALAALAAWRAFPRGGPRARRPWVRGVLTALLGGAVLAPAWLLPIVTLPAPGGPFPVGRTDRVVIDGPRGRRLMATVWYPAERPGPDAPLFGATTLVPEGLARAFGMPAAAPFLAHLRFTPARAAWDVPARRANGPFPVLVFSHGMTGTRTQNATTFLELASRGFAVVAVDHTDAAAVTRFPDGEVRPFDLRRFGIGPDEVQRSNDVLLPVWIADQRAVYGAVARWAARDPLLAGRLDGRAMGAFGHSFGGVVSVAACRVLAPCRAAVNLDGGFVAPPSAGGADRPFLILSAEESGADARASRGWARSVAASGAGAGWAELEGGGHLSFTVLSLVSPLLAPRGLGARSGLRAADAAVVAFFERHVRGAPARPLGAGWRWRARCDAALGAPIGPCR